MDITLASSVAEQVPAGPSPVSVSAQSPKGSHSKPSLGPAGSIGVFVAVAQAARDLDVAQSVLRRWMRQLTTAPAFPGNGRMRAELAEIAALRKEVARLWAERDILKNRHGPQPACARYKQLVLSSAA